LKFGSKVLFEEADKREPKLKERTITLTKLTGESGVQVFENIDWVQATSSSTRIVSYGDPCLI
jgi:hypothetical protein